jgi:GPI mannosyltransferase 3
MTAIQVRKLLVGVLALGLVARLIAWHWGPPLYPDAYFQYMEPAWGRISGVGLQSHEWREGFYSWAIPGYNGAWMALMYHLGLKGSAIGELMKIHWLVVSLLMVWAAWRGGASLVRQAHQQAAPHCYEPGSGWQGGLCAALLVATFPLLCLFSVEPISELPSMIGMLCGLCFTAELVERGNNASMTSAAAVGFVLSLSVCLRSVNAPFALLAAYWLFLRGSRRLLIPMALSAVVPVVFFGLLDQITWGDLFHSYITHIRYNVLDGRAVDYGAEPSGWYLKKFLARLPVGACLLIVSMLLAGRATWPFAVATLGYLVLISTQGHKEERFMVIIWPMLLTGAGAAAGLWLTRSTRIGADTSRGTRLRQQLVAVSRPLVVACAAAFIVFEGLHHLGNHEYGLTHARFSGESWVGNQADATGLLVDWSPYTGAYLYFDNTVPFLKFERELLANRIFSHAMLTKGSDEVRQAVQAGFVPLFERDSIVILRRNARAGQN